MSWTKEQYQAHRAAMTVAERKIFAEKKRVQQQKRKETWSLERWNKSREQRKAFYRKHHKRIREKAKIRYAENAPLLRAKQSIYNRRKRALNPLKRHPMPISIPHTEQQRRLCLKNRTMAKNAGYLHSEHDFNVEAELHAKAILLTATTGVIHHVDHIIPTALGGFHHHFNLQVLPSEVNAAKSQNPVWQQPGYKSWRDVPEFLWPENLRSIYTVLKLHLPL